MTDEKILTMSDAQIDAYFRRRVFIETLDTYKSYYSWTQKRLQEEAAGNTARVALASAMIKRLIKLIEDVDAVNKNPTDPAAASRTANSWVH